MRKKSRLGRFAIKNQQAASRSVFGMTDVACDGSESSLGECLHRWTALPSQYICRYIGSVDNISTNIKTTVYPEAAMFNLLVVIMKRTFSIFNVRNQEQV